MLPNCNRPLHPSPTSYFLLNLLFLFILPCLLFPSLPKLPSLLNHTSLLSLLSLSLSPSEPEPYPHPILPPLITLQPLRHILIQPLFFGSGSYLPFLESTANVSRSCLPPPPSFRPFSVVYRLLLNEDLIRSSFASRIYLRI